MTRITPAEQCAGSCGVQIPSLSFNLAPPQDIADAKTMCMHLLIRGTGVLRTISIINRIDFPDGTRKQNDMQPQETPHGPGKLER